MFNREHFKKVFKAISIFSYKLQNQKTYTPIAYYA